MSKKRASSSGLSTIQLLDLDFEESSSDSDFRIEDHDDSGDDFSDNSNDNEDEDNGDDDDDDEESGNSESSDNDFSCFKNSLTSNSNGKKSTAKSKTTTATTTTTKSATKSLTIEQQLKAKEAFEKANAKLLATPICCACLGDRSDDTNEIVECDNCGISVHEGCYGISDSGSVSSTVSSCSTEPWFCEACKANISDPVCELCPNKGGIFKETDVGKWVHLVCALYVPGVAFGEVDQLSSVTLFEMQYSKWGAKTCSLCDDIRYARTGVCIGCDAGMCKTYFHVTCAQAAGLLSEPHSEEADHADPFYAHCKIHSDKSLIKHRKRNYNGLLVKMNYRLSELDRKKADVPTDGQKRIERKLKKHRTKYVSHKTTKQEPWVPTQKMPRLLTTSATACRKLMYKSELMDIDTAAAEFQETQLAALTDVRKKWHIPAAFSVEFIGYYLDRISRLKDIKKNLQEQTELNVKLVDEQQILRDQYDQKVKLHSDYSEANTVLKESVDKLHATIQALCPNKSLPPVDNIGRSSQPVVEVPVVVTAPARPMSVPTAAALKMGVGFPLTNLPGTNEDTNRILSTQCQNNSKLMHECGICKRRNDQHMLAKCDTCHLYYHLGCLNPPLTRHPKKSKLYGWQCSECVKSDDSDGAVTLPAGPRKSRTKYSKDGTIVPVDPPQPPADSNTSLNVTPSLNNTSNASTPPAARTPKTPTKKIEKKPPEPKAKIEEVLVVESIVVANNDTTTKIKVSSPPPVSAKRKKHKNNSMNNKLEQSNKMDDALSDAPDDPLDISNSELIILPAKKSKTTDDESTGHVTKSKSNKKIRKEKPSYYIDRNGVLSCIDHVPSSLPKAGHFTSELISSNGGGSGANGDGSSNHHTNNELSHKQNRKRRKDKHRNKHGADSDRSTSKEHKKKRKRKNHDMENPNQNASEGIPRIKIKFKALPLPGEAAAEPQCFYVSADMVRPAAAAAATTNYTTKTTTTATTKENHKSPSSRRIHNASSPLSSATSPVVVINDIKNIKISTTATQSAVGGKNHTAHIIRSPQKSSMSILPPPQSTTLAKPLNKPMPIRSRRLSVISPRKSIKELLSYAIPPPAAPAPPTTNHHNTSSSSVNNLNSISSNLPLCCDVCHKSGTVQDLVKCDECKKNYHFHCLEPPVKKTPKRRGYSWHCADCDPTDTESTN